MMKVIISAGGTGGHIYPALAIIDLLKKHYKDLDILYIGTHNRMEKDIIPALGIKYEPIEIYGFSKKKIFRDIKNIFLIRKAEKRCEELMNEFKPDIVIGVGGYVTHPVISAPHSLGIKTFIHEQNSVAGKANLSLAHKADLIGVSFKSSINDFPKNKTIFVGNPCGDDALTVKPAKKSEFGLDDNKKMVLFVMGSQGAGTINEYLTSIMKYFDKKDYSCLFVTGTTYYDEVIKNKFPSNIKVVPYIENMTRIMKNTDLIVTRAGASTLSEIIALNIPSILIPSPYVPNNHQYKNAIDFVQNNASVIVEEKELKDDKLVKVIDELIMDDNKLNKMKENLSKLKVVDSAAIIYNSIKKLINR